MFCVLFNSRLAHAELTDKFKTNTATTEGWLKLEITEAESEGPRCDLVITQLLYVKELKVLNLQVQEQAPCPLEAIGPRKAELKWKLPFNAVSEGLHVRINGQPYRIDLTSNHKKAGSR